MSSSNLVRWSGLSALIGGVIFIILDILESVLFAGLPESEAALTASWIVVQVGFIVAALLISLGLVGLYARQAEQAGTFGLVAFVVAFIGEMMAIGSTWSEAFFGPWLAEVAPQILSSDPTGTVIAGILLTYLLFALGWLLFGLASLRSGELPRGASVLLMIGAVIFPVLGFLEIPLSAVLYGAAVAWMGYALLSGEEEAAILAEGVT